LSRSSRSLRLIPEVGRILFLREHDLGASHKTGRNRIFAVNHDHRTVFPEIEILIGTDARNFPVLKDDADRFPFCRRMLVYTFRNPDENPWARFTSTYGVGDVAKVTIVKLMPFGAFAEVLPGVDGLIHISQIANRRIGQPSEVLNVGDVVDAKITNIDNEKQKISLSIRALSEPAPVEREVVEEEPQGDALVYEVSADGTATGEAPEEE